MNRANSRAWLLTLLLWPLIGAVSLAGCAPRTTDIANGSEVAYDPVVYQDKATGCEYLSTGQFSVLTPRIAADGHTHLGCGSIK